MRYQEIVGIHEAYSSIYSQPVELSEEVEIAAQYFYEMGLNEEGVDILIEDLGVDEFAEFVYDIAEDYVLTEARVGGVKIEPKTSKGKAIEGKPSAQSLKALRKKKAARAEAEKSASEAKPSGLKSSLRRQSAVVNAAKKQPKKPGLLDRVAGAVNRGIERHNKAMGELKKMKSATDVTVGKVKKAAGEFKKGLTEGTDLFDYFIEYLISEGYADTNEAALAIMVNMSEEWREEIIESRVSELGDRLKDLQQRSATTDVKAQRTAKLARDRFNDLSDKEKEFRKGVEDFARATKD
jgi:hypothetical protein